MATCTLIFEDTDDGEVTAFIILDPPPGTDCEAVLSDAQQVGMRMLETAVAEVQTL